MIGDIYKYRIILPNVKALASASEPKHLLYEGEGHLVHITKEDSFILEDAATGELFKAKHFWELQRIFDYSAVAAEQYEHSGPYKGPKISRH